MRSHLSPVVAPNPVRICMSDKFVRENLQEVIDSRKTSRPNDPESSGMLYLATADKSMFRQTLQAE